MRLDEVAPRTLLIGAFAGWALVAWALALAGMGGRLPQAPGGAITGDPLPGLPKGPAAPVLGPYDQYAQISARPLLSVDRRPHAFSLVSNTNAPADAPPDFDLVLTSVLITPQAHIAIVQKPDGSEAWRVRVGSAPDAQPNWHLVELRPRAAVFEGPGGRKQLALRVFDGKGAQAPGMPASAGTGVPLPTVETPVMAGGPSPQLPTKPAAQPSTPAPPATDAATQPDPAQIEQIRQRIEARREEMRRNAQHATPPATVAPATPPAKR